MSASATPTMAYRSEQWHRMAMSIPAICFAISASDFLSTHTEGGEIANRPMSNNGDVTYDGTSFYFTYETARVVSDVQRNPKVALGFSSAAGIFSDGIYVAVEGKADLIRDKAVFQQHWRSDLDKWFERGVDTPGIVLIKVKATRATYWKGREEGEIEL